MAFRCHWMSYNLGWITTPYGGFPGLKIISGPTFAPASCFFCFTAKFLGGCPPTPPVPVVLVIGLDSALVFAPALEARAFDVTSGPASVSSSSRAENLLGVLISDPTLVCFKTGAFEVEASGVDAASDGVGAFAFADAASDNVGALAAGAFASVASDNVGAFFIVGVVQV